MDRLMESAQRDLRILDRYQQYALAAAEMAIIDSGT